MHTRWMGAAAIVLVAACGAGNRNSATSSPDGTGTCGWSSRADKQTSNIAYPDTSATYWGITYALAPGEHLQLTGRLPAARYASFVTYGPAGGAIDSLTDVDITGDRGSDSQYTVTIEGDVPTHDGDDRLAAEAQDPTASTTTTNPVTAPRIVVGTGGSDAVRGSVLYRVYLPNDAADPTGGTGLPSVRLVDGSQHATAIRTCANPGASQTALDIVNNFDRPVPTPPSTPVFIRPDQRTVNLYPNPDNVYVATTIGYQPGRVVVVRGRAPTFPNTRQGDTIGGNEQTRFWSMCTNEFRKPYPVTDCAADESTQLDAAGFYTYVVSTLADRPASTAATAGSTWLDWGATDVPGLLLMRHMLPNPSFAQAANRVAPGALAEPTMGDYAPHGAYCDKAVFEAGGYAACGL